MQSAPGAMLPPTPDQADATGRRLLNELGVDAAGLAKAPVAEILAAQHRVRGSGTGGPLDATPPFHPVATPGLVAADPIAAVGESAGAGTTLMVGTTADEAAAFFTGDPRAETLPADRLDAIAAQWFGDDDPGVRDPAAMTTEYMFTRPAARLAELLRAAGKPCDTYRFAWHPPSNPLRACHCMELPFVFGTRSAWRRAPMLTGADTEITGRITESVQHRWLSFIRDEPIEADPLWGRADERMRPPTPKGI
ncbi:carboxylesterase family protein [Nocardia nova]|uniref:carboxylesterase family protein n=1 Tax=Nocardia nova TaxID=37330 RepID=UPI0011DD9B94|nr:carboxylesterase family protein [Nocardia nova]